MNGTRPVVARSIGFVVLVAVWATSCSRTFSRRGATEASGTDPLLQCAPAQFANPDSAADGSNLVFPGMLENEALLGGNPLATYSAMRSREGAYMSSKMYRPIYPEIRLAFEEFMGVPCAGVQAMQLIPQGRQGPASDTAGIGAYEARNAIDVIAAQAERTRIVILAEEHHLPQTRSIIEPLLPELHRRGYRYFAAEAFGDADVSRLTDPDYRSGYYVRDPVFASAIRAALELGYKLVSYDTREQRADAPSFRDSMQAENLFARVLRAEGSAKLLVVAGRLHAAEIQAPDGWTPMGYALKRVSGIDPFTVFTPTMTSRLSAEAEHPWYRAATAMNMINEPSILLNRDDGSPYGSGAFDAHAFFPRTRLRNGRPDWLARVLGRTPVSIPSSLRVTGAEMRLVQAFPVGAAPSSVPSDQLLLFPGAVVPDLMLSAGKYRIRGIGARGDTTPWVEVSVPGFEKR